MKKRTLISILFLLPFWGCRDDVIGPTSECTVEDHSGHPNAAAYQNMIDTYTKAGLPGISMLVRDQYGTWAGAAGMADIERQIPMRACHVSKVASITKLFIGALSMKLVEEGYFELDDPLTKWLPKRITKKVANAGQATMEDLLRHTSGIPDVIEDNGFYLAVLNDPSKFWKPEELLEYIYNGPAVFPVRERVSYSNTNLLLAIMVIESATGRSHAELLREKILDPLGLQDSYYHWHEALPPFTAQGYYDLYNNGTILNLSNFNTGSGNGYGGLYSTVFDLQVFIEALFREKTLLQPESLETMLTYTEREYDNDRAFGITVNKDFIGRAPDEFGLGHRGRDLAYTADLYYFPNQDITIAYLVNYGTDANSGLKPVFLEFRNKMVDLIMEK
ncbi:MAG: beta-lactamase family protein [Phaeodactylibacter sp.]|nr:beta-lactamase family protein [Phaeodactylibacter sp.]MCB9273275.1 beta-lactamase family protein [Lewinellaceae bacterium]